MQEVVFLELVAQECKVCSVFDPQEPSSPDIFGLFRYCGILVLQQFVERALSLLIDELVDLVQL